MPDERQTTATSGKQQAPRSNQKKPDVFRFVCQGPLVFFFCLVSFSMGAACTEAPSDPSFLEKKGSTVPHCLEAFSPRKKNFANPEIPHVRDPTTIATRHVRRNSIRASGPHTTHASTHLCTSLASFSPMAFIDVCGSRSLLSAFRTSAFGARILSAQMFARFDGCGGYGEAKAE